MIMKLKSINFPELSFKLTNNNPQPQKGNVLELKLNPQFKRAVLNVNTNDNVKLLNLICSMPSTYTDPKPFDLTVSIMGVFEVEDFEPTQFQYEATSVLFPYLRMAISNLTNMACFPPINLPLMENGILFPEDRYVANVKDIKTDD